MDWVDPFFELNFRHRQTKEKNRKQATLKSVSSCVIGLTVNQDISNIFSKKFLVFFYSRSIFNRKDEFLLQKPI